MGAQRRVVNRPTEIREIQEGWMSLSTRDVHLDLLHHLERSLSHKLTFQAVQVRPFLRKACPKFECNEEILIQFDT
jgi:hypothetical protein